MSQPILYNIKENNFWLSPDRFIYWEEENTLILSDTHFGKTGHFRKNGIAVPQEIYKNDLQRFFSSVASYKAKRVIIVGDLFHSIANLEMNLFLKWRNDQPNCEFILVKGNHDILNKSWYKNAEIQVQEGLYILNKFGFIHDPADLIENSILNYCFVGHIHPGASIQGNAKQKLHFPCFYFSDQTCILPAFSKFTGVKIVKKKKGDTVYALADGLVIKL
jgi:uncharacterized protein